VSKIGVRQSSKQCSMGKRLMIIELRKYIEVGELLIEKGSTVSQAQVIYRVKDRRVSVTRALSALGEGTGQADWVQGAYNRSPSRNENRYAYDTVEQLTGISMQ